MNREIYPSSVYPITGDVVSTAGTAPVKVTGLQGVPVINPFLTGGLFGGQTLQFNTVNRGWTATLIASIQINNVTVSDDYSVSVNAIKQIKVNGV